MTQQTRPQRFHRYHQRDAILLMPNPWDVGSAKLLADAGFEALATTSAGLAWSLGLRDGQVTREQLVAHVAALTAAVDVPVNVDSEWCFPRAHGGVGETVHLLAAAGAAGCSIEDWNPIDERIEPLEVAVTRVREVVAANRGLPDPLVITGRCENHLHGVDDLDDTVRRLQAYRDAGVDCAFAPGLADPAGIARIVREVGIPVNVIVRPDGPAVGELHALGVRRVSTGGSLARQAYGTLLHAATELRERGRADIPPSEALRAAFARAFG